MNLEGIMLSGLSQTKKGIYSVSTYVKYLV